MSEDKDTGQNPEERVCPRCVELIAERDRLKDALERKYDVMSWLADEGGLTLMKQDGAMVDFDCKASDATPSGPPRNREQRCLLIPAKHWNDLNEKLMNIVTAIDAFNDTRPDIDLMQYLKSLGRLLSLADEARDMLEEQTKNE